VNVSAERTAERQPVGASLLLNRRGSPNRYLHPARVSRDGLPGL